jgi:hypothetical protein
MDYEVLISFILCQDITLIKKENIVPEIPVCLSLY